MTLKKEFGGNEQYTHGQEKYGARKSGILQTRL